MKSKMIAVVMAVMMVATATAVVASGNTDADDITRDVYVGAEGSVNIVFNIVEPDSNYYTNTVKWNGVSVNGDTETQVVSNENYTIEIKGSNGMYVATVTGKAVAVQTAQKLTYEITSSIRENHDAGDVVQTLTYALNITVVSSPLKTDFKLTGTVGTAISADTTVTAETSDFQYAYYAVGLPEGVQMNPQGTISGTPLAEGSDTFTVIATHKASNMTSTATYNYSIVAAGTTDDFTFTVGGNPADDGDEFVVASNGTIEVVTKIGGSVTNITSFELINIDDGDDRTTVTGDEGTYRIESTMTSGTGSYMVVMTNGDVTHSFELVVVANPYDISTGIRFTPGGP